MLREKRHRVCQIPDFIKGDTLPLICMKVRGISLRQCLFQAVFVAAFQKSLRSVQ